MKDVQLFYGLVLPPNVRVDVVAPTSTTSTTTSTSTTTTTSTTSTTTILITPQKPED